MYFGILRGRRKIFLHSEILLVALAAEVLTGLLVTDLSYSAESLTTRFLDRGDLSPIPYLCLSTVQVDIVCELVYLYVQYLFECLLLRPSYHLLELNLHQPLVSRWISGCRHGLKLCLLS